MTSDRSISLVSALAASPGLFANSTSTSRGRGLLRARIEIILRSAGESTSLARYRVRGRGLYLVSVCESRSKMRAVNMCQLDKSSGCGWISLGLFR